jgi:indole-3-glycerol phosphate synthase
MRDFAPAALESLAHASRARAEADMKDRPLADLEDLIATLPAARSLGARLSRSAGPLPRVIAEVGPPDRSEANERADYQPRRMAMGYARVGAAAISVVTEPDLLGGALDHLHEVRAAHLPILRSDVLITPYQLAQSRAAGADAVRLIAGLLRGAPLALMVQAARRYGLEAMVDARGREEAAAALDAGAALLGLWGGPAAARPRDLPHGVTAVACGGVRTPADLRGLLDEGYEAFLLDAPLSNARDPGDALWAFLERS